MVSSTVDEFMEDQLGLLVVAFEATSFMSSSSPKGFKTVEIGLSSHGSVIKFPMKFDSFRKEAPSSNIFGMFLCRLKSWCGERGQEGVETSENLLQVQAFISEWVWLT